MKLILSEPISVTFRVKDDEVVLPGVSTGPGAWTLTTDGSVTRPDHHWAEIATVMIEFHAECARNILVLSTVSLLG